MTKIITKRPSQSFEILNGLMKESIKLFFKLPIIQDKTINDKPAQKIVKLYSKGEYAGLSTKIRFWDAPLNEIEKRVPKQGTILDLGCGEGIFSNYLGLSSPRRKVIGIEFNKIRVKTADHGVKNVKFQYGNVITKPLPKSDSIVLGHMLHHLQSKKDQVNVLKRCYQSLNKKGYLVIAEVDKSLTLKYLLGWITDVVIVPILFEKQFYDHNIFHRSQKDWKQLLEKTGFKVTSMELIKSGPFPDLIIVARK